MASPIPISDETRPKICPKPSPGKITRTKSAKTQKRGRKIPSLKKTKLPVCQPNQLQGLHEVLFPFSKLSARLSAYEIGFRILFRVLEVLFAKFCNTRPKPAYGRQGLDWIVGPGSSFAVFSTVGQSDHFW